MVSTFAWFYRYGRCLYRYTGIKVKEKDLRDHPYLAEAKHSVTGVLNLISTMKKLFIDFMTFIFKLIFFQWAIFSTLYQL